MSLVLNNAEQVFTTFCQYNSLEFGKTSREWLQGITYHYQATEHVVAGTFSYQYSYDVPNRGARIPRTIIVAKTNNKYSDLVISTNSGLKKIWKQQPFIYNHQVTDQGELEIHLHKLKSSIPNFSLSVKSDEVTLEFKWFPDTAEQLEIIRRDFMMLIQFLIE